MSAFATLGVGFGGMRFIFGDFILGDLNSKVVLLHILFFFVIFDALTLLKQFSFFYYSVIVYSLVFV